MFLNVIEIVILVAVIFLTANYNKHYLETKDSSLQGFIEYLKEKYYEKH